MSLANSSPGPPGEFTRDDLFLMEAGSNSFEIHRRLLALGLRAVVMESCHVGKHAKTYADNDKMAAAPHRLGLPPGKGSLRLGARRLTRERRKLLHALHQGRRGPHRRHQLPQRLPQPVHHPHRPPDPRNPGHRKMGAQPARLDPAPTRELLAGYYRNLRFQSERRKVLQRLIGRQICAEPLMLRCMKLLGISQINAFALLAIIGDVRRFERPEKLVAYIGLNPGQREERQPRQARQTRHRQARPRRRATSLCRGAHAVLRTGKATPLGAMGLEDLRAARATATSP
ncbi:MAG: transposase [Akkermansiaceae bacterium]|nr:transposase [Akkermansiaceae bacterium]